MPISLNISLPPINLSIKPPVIPPIRPAVIPSLRLPPSAIVPIPVPKADAANAGIDAPAIAGAAIEKSKGKNASFCPVSGLVVNCPVGDREASISTSIGFMCTIMVSPYLPLEAKWLAASLSGFLLFIVVSR